MTAGASLLFGLPRQAREGARANYVTSEPGRASVLLLAALDGRC